MKRTGPPKRKTRLQARKPMRQGKAGKRSGSAPHKRGPWRNPQYLAWVRTLPCCVCGAPADDAHHITGVGQLGGVGTKPSDEYVMPVCRGDHGLIERTPSMWPDQWAWVRQTQQQAVEAGWLTEVTV